MPRRVKETLAGLAVCTSVRTVTPELTSHAWRGCPSNRAVFFFSGGEARHVGGKGGGICAGGGEGIKRGVVGVVWVL